MNAHLLHLPESIAIYEAALEGLSRINERIYEQNPSLPEIHKAKVKYRRERGEAWRHVADVLSEGWGDCEDLATARVGWLRAKNIDRGARVKVKRTGPHMTHAQVLRSNGVIEDPSKDLGMGTMEGRITMNPLHLDEDDMGLSLFRRKKKKKAKRSKSAPPPTQSTSADSSDSEDEDDSDGDWEEIGADVSSSAELTWTVEKTSNGWRGTVRVPLRMGKCLLVSRTIEGSFPSMAAVKKAARAASSVLNNPVAAAVVPPEARFALNLARSEKAREMAKKILKLY